MRIFISYGHDEYSAFARRLAEDLESAGHEVLIDYKYITPGEAWDYAIFRKAFNSLKVDRENSVLVYIMTSHSVDINYDHYSMDEVLEARSSRIRVIPIRLEPVQAPPLVKRFNWIDATDVWPIEQHKDAYERVLRQLLEALKPREEKERSVIEMENSGGNNDDIQQEEFVVKNVVQNNVESSSGNKGLKIISLILLIVGLLAVGGVYF